MDLSLQFTASPTAVRLRAALVSMLMSMKTGLFQAEDSSGYSWCYLGAETQDEPKTRSYQDRGPEGERKSVEGLGRPATQIQQL